MKPHRNPMHRWNKKNGRTTEKEEEKQGQSQEEASINTEEANNTTEEKTKENKSTDTVKVEQQTENKTSSNNNSSKKEESKPKNVTTTKTTTATESIPFETVRQNDASLEKGKEVVAQNGQNGVRTITYKETYVNGKLTKKEQVPSKVTKNPVNKVIKVGTKQPAPTTKTSGAKSILNEAGVFGKSYDGTEYFYLDSGVVNLFV